MQESEVLAALADILLGGFRFFSTVGSTNDEALAWAAAGAYDLSIVVADEQTAGRGRSGRQWHTPRGAALAVSVILRPTPIEEALPARITGLAALALVECCRGLGLEAQIKWPNDILLNGRKAAGILVESAWTGHQLEASVVGIGANISQQAIPAADRLSFPATSLETELRHPVARLTVLRDTLKALVAWRSRLGTDEFLVAWDQALAFRGEQVSVSRDGEPPLNGTLAGLEPDGSLRLIVHDKLVIIHFGEIHLRPSDDRIGRTAGGAHV